MVTYHLVRDVLERTLDQHGPDASALAGVVAELVPLDQRSTAYEDVCGKLRTAMWLPSRRACEMARVAWRALPMEVR
jgi:hypothetical protein